MGGMAQHCFVHTMTYMYTGMDMTDDVAIDKRLLSTMELPAGMEPPDFLVRSRSEVQRVLAGMLAQRTPVSVHFAGADGVVASALLQIEEHSGALMFECPPRWRASIEAADGKSAMLVCAHEHAKIQFQGGCGAMAQFDGRAVARIAAPEFIWRFQRRRDRRCVAPSLKITLNLGFIESEAEVADLSVSGIGVVNCDSDVNLDQGEIMKDCSIALPGVGKIRSDLEVVHQTVVRLIDGASVNRVGCRFSGLSDDSHQLIAHYIESLAEV